MQPNLPNAPPEVAAALAAFKGDVLRAASANVAGLILYGGLARGRYRPGKSDVNVVVLLNDVAASSLATIAPALAAARRAVGIAPMIMTPAEVKAAAVVFPTKFLDIRDHHIVLHGADPFAGLGVPREQIRLRIVQALRNLTLRLRNRYVAILGDHALQAAALVSVARPLAVELLAMLRLAGKETPHEDRTADIFQAAARAFDADRDALAQVAALRQGEPARGDTQELFARLLATMGRLTDCAERLKEAP